MVAREVRQLADSCAETAGNISGVATVVTEAVEYLAGSAQELVDYLSNAILSQFEQSARSGQQYREDAAYIEHCIEEFNSRVERLRAAMDEVAGSITGISGAIDNAASGVNGAAGSTRSLVGDMEGIAAKMHTNQEIVGELQRQTEVFANL
jgi:methyl-accepting chemotaxis protein